MPSTDPTILRLQRQRYYEKNLEKALAYGRSRKRVRTEYNREWRRLHPDRVRAYTQKRLLWDAEKLNAGKRSWYLKNRERILKKRSDYYYANKEAVLEKNKARAPRYRYARKGYNFKYRMENLQACRSKERAKAKRYYMAHRDELIAKSISEQRQRRELFQASGLTDRVGIKKKILEAKSSPFTKCFHCGTLLVGKPIHFDHLQPISRMGKHIPDNLVPSCQPCNQSKKDKTVEEWNDYKLLCHKEGK